jgi:hypothetical protein
METALTFYSFSLAESAQPGAERKNTVDAAGHPLKKAKCIYTGFCQLHYTPPCRIHKAGSVK